MDTTLEAAVWAIITVSMLVASTAAQSRHHRFPDAVQQQHPQDHVLVLIQFCSDCTGDITLRQALY